MKFFNWFSGKKKDKALTLQQFFGSSNPNFKNLNPDDKAILKYYSGTVYAAAQRHSDKIAGVTLRLYSRKATSNKLKSFDAKALIQRTNAKYITTSTNIGEVTRHDALTLLHRPNPYMSGRAYRKYVELYNVITGVCYSEIKWMEETPIQLWLMPPHKVEVTNGKQGLPESYTYCGDTLKPKDVLVETAENLGNPYSAEHGLSPVRAITDKLQLSNYITDKLVALMSAPKFTGILTPRGEDANLTEEQRIRWESKLSQYRNSKEGDLLFLDGDVRFEGVSQNATDLAAVEINKQIDELIARVFQMPLMILRGSEGTSRASYEAATQEWVDGGISARLREIEDWLNYMFLPHFQDSEDLFFAYDDPSPLNEKQDVELYTLACGGPYLTVNEARQETGWELREDGNVIRGLEAEYLPEVEAPTETAPDAPGEAVDALPPSEQELNTNPALTLNGAQISSAVSIVQQVAQGLLPRDAALGMLQTLVNLSPEQANACMGSVGVTFNAPDEDEAKSVKKQETPPTGKALNPFVKILVKHFDKWKSSVEGSIGKQLDKVETKSIDGKIIVKELPKKFIPSKKWAADLAKDSQPVVEIFLKERGHKLLQRVGASPDVFNVFNKNVSKFAKETALNFAESTLETTSKSINAALDATRDALAEGLEQGDTIADLRSKIGDIFEDLSTHRANLIAQTESSRAYHEGLRISSKASGVVKGFKHLTSSEPCPICEELNGTEYGLDDPLPPENSHPNCLCTISEVLDESMLTDEGDD